MFKSPLKLTFIPVAVPFGDKLSTHFTDEHLTMRYTVLQAAVAEARAARQQFKQTRSELESGERSHRQTERDRQERVEAYASAALRAQACREPLYNAMFQLQAALTQAQESLADKPRIEYHDNWRRYQVLLNNFLCAVELYKLALSEYEAIPQPPMEPYIWDHLHRLGVTSSDGLNGMPKLPERFAADRNLADLLAAANAATLVENDRQPGTYYVATGQYPQPVIDEVAKRLRASGWSVRTGRGEHQYDLVLTRKKKQ